MREDKTLKSIVEGVELKKEMEILLVRMRYDIKGSSNYIPHYRKKYGIGIASLLGAVLETYHQLRLQDND